MINYNLSSMKNNAKCQLHSKSFVFSSSPTNFNKHKISEEFEQVQKSNLSFITPTKKYSEKENSKDKVSNTSSSLPFKTLFAKENYLATQLNTSFSTSVSTNDSYEYITKYKSSISYLHDQNKSCSNENEINIEIKTLQQSINLLKEELERFKIENKILTATNLELKSLLDKLNMKSNGRLNELDKLNKLLNRYKEMLLLHFDFFDFLSTIINTDDVLIKGDVDFYRDNKHEHNELIRNYKNWFNNLTKPKQDEKREVYEYYHLMQIPNKVRYRGNKPLQMSSHVKVPSLKANRSFSNYTRRGNCFACDVGCNISNSGYSPMTYSPYEINIKRKRNAVTPLNIKNGQYYQYRSNVNKTEGNEKEECNNNKD
jgi:hypothetical protein